MALFLLVALSLSLIIKTPAKEVAAGERLAQKYLETGHVFFKCAPHLDFFQPPLLWAAEALEELSFRQISLPANIPIVIFVIKWTFSPFLFCQWRASQNLLIISTFADKYLTFCQLSCLGTSFVFGRINFVIVSAKFSPFSGLQKNSNYICDDC